MNQATQTTTKTVDTPLQFPASWKNTSATLGHDWLTGMRGGERVLEILCQGFPDATIHTLIHKPEAISACINEHTIHASWLQRLPGIFSYYRNFVGVFPSIIESMDVADTDLLITTSHCVAKGLKQKPTTKHICYCFTPMRYAWTFFDEYFGGSPVKAAIAKPVMASLRRWDSRSSSRVDRFVAISQHVRKRIKDYYNRDSDVVYPPVDITRCVPSETPPQDFDLIVSALVPYKKIDLAVQAYNKLGYPLKIVGVGTDTEHLRSMAQPNIEFLGWRPDDEVLRLYQSCRMLIFPGEEDFGIVPLEAQACGRPVVAFGKGGALETVEEGVSGLFFKEQTPESLLEAVRSSAENSWDRAAIRANALKFGTQHFINGLAGVINDVLSPR
jgi:glycosyltransferase involved in cell wall biosynthesis